MTIPDDSGTHATLADLQDSNNPQGLPRGSTLGRYVIIEPIGSGGMGTVYRAYDPQLNRGVALKILSVRHADLQAAERAQARLIREAQALAQLSHPNVVAVHDAGALEEDVFIAMELVEGKTLDEWIKEDKRSVKETLTVMIAAGRGLSAAHKAGLVHRDFKPGNVMVGDDGRIRVLDFGLARGIDQELAIEEGPPESEAGGEQSQASKNHLDSKEISSDSSSNFLQSSLTQAGGILGTPSYMAPEQHLGLKTDERTDQFGFCVVLYEALYGKRPFEARTREELKSEVIRQEVCLPRADTDVPGWLWQIVRKGLCVKPEDRYPSIDSLLDDLDEDPQEQLGQKRLARRRKMLLISLILLVVALPVGVWYGLRYRTFQLCQAADGELDGVWDEGTKASVKTAFLVTKKTYSLGTWERVERTIDHYLVDWKQMRRDVCEAKWIRGTASEDLFDLRMSCLRKRLGELGALVTVFTRADAGVMQKAVQASASLTGMKICADEKTLRAPYPLPKTKEEKAKVALIREKLSQVVAFERTGKYQEGLGLVKKLELRAKAIDYSPVQAEARYWLGKLLEKTGEYKTAEVSLNEAARVAGENQDALLAAKAMTQLVWIVGYRQARHEAGLVLSQYAKVMLDVAGGNETVRAVLLNNIGVLFDNQGEHSQALEYYRYSIAIRERVQGPDHHAVAPSLNNMARVYYNMVEYDKALEYLDKALSIREKTLGSDHPLVASSLNNMGSVFQEQGKNDKALEYHRRALAIRENTLGSNHPLVALSLDNMGIVTREKEDYDRSLEYHYRALAIRETTLGPDHPNVAWSLSGIGIVLVEQGKPMPALEPLERAVTICEKKICHQDPFGIARFGLARALVATSGDHQRAIKLVKQAQEIFGKNPKRFTKELQEVKTWLKKHGDSKLAKKAHP